MARPKLRMPEAAAIRRCIDEQGLIDVRVTPNASADGIIVPAVAEARILAIRTTATPEQGKANDAILRLLARALDLPVSRLALVRGSTSRNKLVRVLEGE